MIMLVLPKVLASRSLSRGKSGLSFGSISQQWHMMS